MNDPFERASAAFARENARDPTLIADHGSLRPRELVQAERLSRWVERLSPDASEPLRLAARCQHLGRFEIPRTSYPDGRIGYLEWRKALARFHADRAAEILSREGYDAATCERVRAFNLKRGMKVDPEVQTMEDALCLSFLEHEIDDFSAKHSKSMLIDILQKTWRKMSERGHAAALLLPLSPLSRALIEEALGLPHL